MGRSHENPCLDFNSPVTGSDCQSISSTAGLTHDFVIMQGDRSHDTIWIEGQGRGPSVPTWYGRYLMRSILETQWARHFEQKGYSQVGRGIVETLPCYFYEPRGMKKWPGYTGGHYRIDFVLVHEVETILFKDEKRSRATRWEWVSIKPRRDDKDLEFLRALRRFDSRHQRAFQCVGDPKNHIIYEAHS